MFVGDSVQKEIKLGPLNDNGRNLVESSEDMSEVGLVGFLAGEAAQGE